MKKLFVLLLAAIMLLSLLAGCKANPNAEETKPNDTKPAETKPGETKPAETEPVGESETPLQLMWYQATGIESQFEPMHRDKQCLMADAVFNQLLYTDPFTGEYVGCLIDDWGSNEDSTQFWIQVSKGVKFHDGHEMDANDIYFTYMYTVSSPNSRSQAKFKELVGYQEYADGKADNISGLRVEGDKIYFDLVQGNKKFLSTVNTYVLPEHCFDKSMTWEEMDTCDYWKKPIGTGAYMIDEVSFPDYFTCVRYEDYHWPKAGIKNIMFQSYQSGGNEAQATAIMAGDLDYIGPKVVTTLEQAEAIIEQNPDVAYNVMADGSHRSFIFNLTDRADGKTKELLKNPQVRKAISLLIDDETIATFYPGIGQHTSVCMNPNYPEAHPDIMANHVSYDAETAKKLLTDAGWNFDTDILDIAYYYTDQTTYDVMGYIQQTFRQAGVKVNPWLMQGNLADQIYKEKNYDLILVLLDSSISSNAAAYRFATSDSTYKDFMGDNDRRAERYDALYNEYKLLENGARRTELSRQMQELMYEDNYIIPMYLMNGICMHNAANVQIPEDFYITGYPSYLRWDEWKILH